MCSSCRVPGSIDIKLIEPSGESSPLWQFLKRGEGLHHLCFRTDDVTEQPVGARGEGPARARGTGAGRGLRRRPDRIRLRGRRD